MTKVDPYNLARFVAAQETTYQIALRELHQGRKRSHWIWYIFPQVAGLGRSATAEHYAIRSRAEAVAYLQHELLGPRLRTCAATLLACDEADIDRVMGFPDNLKLRSSITLFGAISDPGNVFPAVLDRYFAGAADEQTLDFLKQEPRSAG